MTEQDYTTHKDAVLAAILRYELTVMPTPKLPVTALEHMLVKDSIFVRGSESRELVQIVFAGHGEIEGVSVPPGTLPGALAEITEIKQISEGDPLLEPISSLNLLGLLTDVIFPAMAT